MFWFPSSVDAKQDANERTTQWERKRERAEHFYFDIREPGDAGVS